MFLNFVLDQLQKPMKKITFILSLLLTFSMMSSGQKFRAGGRAGLNIMPLENSDLKGHTYSLGYHVGAVGEYRITNWFSISAELVYTTRKKSYEFADTSSFIETMANNPMLGLLGVNINEILDSLGGIEAYVNDHVYTTTKGISNLGYLKIPVLAKFNYKSLYIALGPYVSFLISNKSTEEMTQHIPLVEAMTGLDTIPFYSLIIKGTFPGYFQPFTSTISENKDIKKVDYGVIADISYRLDNNFTVGFRYTQGLTNYHSPEIYKNDFLSAFSFSVGYIIPIKKNTKSLY